MIQQKPDMPAVEAATDGSLLAVDLLNLTVSDPPTQAQMQTIANKIDEILRNAKRQ